MVNTLSQLRILIDGKETLAKRELLFGRTTEIIELQETNLENILVVKNRLPDMIELLNRGLTCDYRILYEVIMMGIKTNLVELQKRVNERETAKQENLLHREDYMARTFGENSQQRYEASEAILRFDDILLRNRATKFKEFLDGNNEKSTKAFCRLSKDGGVCDDMSQIKNARGETFVTEEDRGAHISEFYSNIYKKKVGQYH